jgi:hypothetical protein
MSRTATPEAETALERPEPMNVSALFAWVRAQGSAVRPQYLWGVLQAARAASAVGVERMTVVEFGVAGGNGLLELEAAADEAERHYSTRIDVVGFDSGCGMPEPADHRDLPWVIKAGWLPMDEKRLRARLRRSELVLGPVSETVSTWRGGGHAPVGFAAFDLDYHSSTAEAFAVFDGDGEAVLPRVVCYFDDIFGYGWSDFAGERAAIAEFNASHDNRKIGPIHGLKYELPAEHFTQAWPEQLYLAHLFDHPRYNEFEGVVSEAFLDGHRLR